ncbi:MAG: alpha/beta hydrolase, partial [Ilumatobacteraceae bacterium]
MSTVSVLVAIVLVFGGTLGLLGTWNAVRPLIDPTRWYSPSWLPAMVVTELAPFWLVVHALVVVVGLLLGGRDTVGGRVGTGLLLVSATLLVAVLTRTAVAVRRLRVGIDGPVHPASGVAKLIGRPIPTPPGVIETLGIDWRHGLTLDLTRPDGGPDRMPVAVYVHGGGWTGGDPQRQARDLYHALALDGWTTLAIRYPFTPRVTVEQQISVVRDAVRWTRSGLEAHGVEATHVVLIGGSAGGLLATNAAFTPDHDDARVDACVGQYGVYDMANRNRT